MKIDLETEIKYVLPDSDLTIVVCSQKRRPCFQKARAIRLKVASADFVFDSQCFETLSRQVSIMHMQ